jgi:hypothetical protein
MATTANDVEGGFEPVRRSAAIRDLLNQIGLSDGRKTEWWNFSAYPELGNRNPTQAWQAGDHAAVRQLVEKWYTDTEVTGERLRSNSTFMDLLRSRIEELQGEIQ